MSNDFKDESLKHVRTPINIKHIKSQNDDEDDYVEAEWYSPETGGYVSKRVSNCKLIRFRI